LTTIFNSDNYGGDAPQLVRDTMRFLQASPVTTGLYDVADDPGSAAQAHGNAGYLIYKINGVNVHNVQDMCSIIQSANPGQTLTLSEYNIDGSSSESKLSAEEWLNDQTSGYHDTIVVPKS
jgi:S1-C subfamily serine protease